MDIELKVGQIVKVEGRQLIIGKDHNLYPYFNEYPYKLRVWICSIQWNGEGWATEGDRRSFPVSREQVAAYIANGRYKMEHYQFIFTDYILCNNVVG